MSIVARAVEPGGPEPLEVTPRGRDDMGIRLRSGLDSGAVVQIVLTRSIGGADEAIAMVEGMASVLGATVRRIGRRRVEVVRVSASPRSWGADADAYADETAQAIGRAIRAMPLDQSARLLALGPTPASLADRMIASLPLAGIWDERVGPFHDEPGARALLGVDDQGLARLVERRAVLRVLTGDGEALFPAFQFEPEAEPLAALQAVLEALDPRGLDDWGDALWLNTPADSFGGRSPFTLLSEGQIDAVLQVARRAGGAWLE